MAELNDFLDSIEIDSFVLLSLDIPRQDPPETDESNLHLSVEDNTIIAPLDPLEIPAQPDLLLTACALEQQYNLGNVVNALFMSDQDPVVTPPYIWDEDMTLNMSMLGINGTIEESTFEPSLENDQYFVPYGTDPTQQAQLSSVISLDDSDVEIRAFDYLLQFDSMYTGDTARKPPLSGGWRIPNLSNQIGSNKLFIPIEPKQNRMADTETETDSSLKKPKRYDAFFT
jgi:hypothetical protein